LFLECEATAVSTSMRVCKIRPFAVCLLKADWETAVSLLHQALPKRERCDRCRHLATLFRNIAGEGMEHQETAVMNTSSRSGKVKAIEIHDFVPGSHEVMHKRLL
jgi:hypothetical protein